MHGFVHIHWKKLLKQQGSLHMLQAEINNHVKFYSIAKVVNIHAEGDGK